MADKNRPLHILKYLWDHTDEEHPAIITDILAHLESCGIHTNRKTVASDLVDLQDSGFDIVCNKSRQNQYFIGSRTLELAELKMIVDAVQAAKFISESKSVALIEKIEYEAGKIGKTIDVLLELNSSGEEQKAGFRSADELSEAAGYIMSSCPHIRLRGVMTVGPLGYDSDKNRKAFAVTKDAFDRISSLSPDIDVLSMGMSADWKEALEAGSNEVRIGTAIFGERQ